MWWPDLRPEGGVDGLIGGGGNSVRGFFSRGVALRVVSEGACNWLDADVTTAARCFTQRHNCDEVRRSMCSMAGRCLRWWSVA